MKIIFDSEKQKNDCMYTLCPYDVNSDIDEERCTRLWCENGTDCDDCWKNSGIELEVKDGNS